MTNFRDYEWMDVLGENEYWKMHRVFHKKRKKFYLVKMAKFHPSNQNRRPFLHGYYTEKQFSEPGIFHPEEIFEDDPIPWIVYEDLPVISLKEYMLTERLDDVTALEIFAGLAVLLSVVHGKELVHNYVQPNHIFINRKNKQLYLTGFERATRLIRGSTETGKEEMQRDFLSYLSPEQTGKINRPVDYRADLYSLGCVMYELVVGTPPFGNEDAQEILYAHLAKTPRTPEQVRPNVPIVLSRIIMKLLEKEPENRYQSSLGLKYDLEKGKQYMYEGRTNESFSLGQRDYARFFEVPFKLYGRDSEMNALLGAFQRVKEGRPQILFVSGEPGVGKTALIHEAGAEFAKRGGHFIIGKYDLLKKQDPYRPILQAFTHLVKQIVAQGEKEIGEWRGRLEYTFGSNLQILTEMIPELEWIVGKQKKVRELPAMEEQRRFHITFMKFIQLLTEKIRPIVLFLDDLQWADRASLDLLDYLFSADKCPYFFVIGTYRNGEINTGHPLRLLFDQLEKKRGILTDMRLRSLTVRQTRELITESLHCEKEEGEGLANIMYPLTEGNPLFIRQILYSFYDEGLIRPDEEGRNWTVHFHKMKEMTVDDHIVPFILKKVHKLPEETRNVLKFAACIGNHFQLEDLAAIVQHRPETLARILWDALEHGFLIPLDADYKRIYKEKGEGAPKVRYRFSHDRIQQAVYSSMDDREKEDAHFTIGKWLKANGVEKTGPQDVQFLEMVNHFNISKNRLTPEERLLLSRWNVQAGKRIQKSGAFQQALKFFQEAWALLPENHWETDYELAYELTILTGQGEYLNGNFQDAERLFDEGLVHAKTPLEKLKIYNLLLILTNHINRYGESVNMGVKGLQLYRQKIPRRIGKWRLASEFLFVKLALTGKKPIDLLALPEMENEERKHLLNTYISLNTPTFLINQNLATLFMLRAVRFTLKHGNTETTSLVYNNYALILSAGFNDYKGSYQFGQLAIKHAEKYGNPNLLGRVYFVFATFVNHWRAPLSENISYLERSQSLSLDSGNLNVAGAASSFIVVTYLLTGADLQMVRKKILQELELAKKIDYSLSNHFLTELLQWIDVLSSEKNHFDWKIEPVKKNDSAIVMHYTMRLQVFYLMDEMDFGVETLNELEKLVNNQLTLVVVPEYALYSSLIKLKLLKQEHGIGKKRLLEKQILAQMKRLKKWASHSPENYRHKYLLVLGGYELWEGKEKEGMYHIQQSAQLAGDHGFIHDYAIANEWLGEYFVKKGMKRLAGMYLSEAYRSFRVWGAKQKAIQLASRYPDISFEQTVNSWEEREKGFDMKSVMEATQSLSKEIKTANLLEKYMEIILKNAGAKQGHLLTVKQREGIVMVSGHMDRGITVFEEGKKADARTVPMSIINYVLTSKEEVYLEEAGKSELFSEDPYIVHNQPKSIMCLPIVLNRTLFGLLYLENNLSTKVHFQKQAELLKLLSSQAAIFLINARLYGDLEKTVKERTQELTETNLQLERKNNELAKTEKSLRELFTNISHDLKSPLAAVQGYIYAILDGYAEHPEQQKIYLRKSLARIEELNHLIQDLFELASLQTGRGAFRFEPVGIANFCQMIYDQLSIDVTNHGLAFEMETDFGPAETNLFIHVDRKRMEQVFSNLLSNALKHTKKGKIKIVASLKKDDFLISVQDTGTGINKSDLPYVFDRFFTKSEKGHGIGLAICKEIIVNHGGTIWVESEVGKGTIFYITLPKYNVERATTPAPGLSVGMKNKETD